MSAPASAGRPIYLVGIALALVALALGLWDLLVERDGGDSALFQLLLPVVLLALCVGLYRQSRTEAPREAGDRERPRA